MATKTLFKIGGIGGAGTFAVVDVNGVPFIQINGTIQASIVSLTNSTGGTADNTVVDVGAAFSQATLNNNFSDVTAKINAILVALDGAGITS